MSPLSFVHSDGSTTTNTLNKKLVRSHVSKYFHPKKQEQKRRKQQPIQHCQPRPIAPYRPDAAETSITEDQDTEFEWIDEAILDLSNHDSLVSRSRTPSFLEENCASPPLANNFNFPDNNEYLNNHSDDMYYNPFEYHGIDQTELEFLSCMSDSGTEGGNNIVKLTADVSHDTHTGNNRSWDTNRRPQATQGLRQRLPRMEYSHTPPVRDLLLLRSLDNPVETSVSHESRQLVERYASKVDEGARIRGLVPSNLPLRNAYMPAARHHPALWLASVTHSSTMDRIFQRAPIDCDTLKRKGQCIRAINISLQDPSTRIMDETIAAVQAMATVELVCGNIQAFVVHLTAIHEMVRLRGGLQKLGFGGLLSCIIQMHAWRWELVAQNCQDSVPVFARPQPQPVIPIDLILFTMLPLNSKSIAPPRSVSNFLSDLQSLAITWDTCSISQNRLCSRGTSLFEEQCQRMYHQYSRRSPLKQLKEEWVAEDYEVEAFQLASLLFVSNGVEVEDVRLRSRHERVHQLYESLLKTDMASYWTDIPGALIWCLAVGASESWEYEEYSWFMSNLVPMLMMLAMERWDELERTLNVFGWLFRCRRAGRVLARY